MVGVVAGGGGWRVVAGEWWCGWRGWWAGVAGLVGIWYGVSLPLNTAYVSVSTEPPDYNHGNY